jgi:Transcriptional regulator, AbiEi antitoxin/Protein of unknown function (DUF559)
LNKSDAPPGRDALLAAVAGRQHGLVTLAQLADAGLGRAAVSYRTANGRLHHIHRGVYAVGHRRLSRHARWMAAVLAAGEGAALSHLSAAALWEIWRGRERDCDIVAPRRREVTGTRIRTYRSLEARDVTVRDGIPVTSVARTLVDLTDVLDHHQLANVIHEAAFRKRFDPEATQGALSRAAGRHRLHVLARALAAHESGSAGTRSSLEDRFLAIVASAGLPEPIVNSPVQAGGRRIEVDFQWPELGLCVEIDGDGHGRARTRRVDRARDEALCAVGRKVLRLTAIDLAQPANVLAQLRAAGLAPQRARRVARIPAARWPSSVQ